MTAQETPTTASAAYTIRPLTYETLESLVHQFNDSTKPDLITFRNSIMLAILQLRDSDLTWLALMLDDRRRDESGKVKDETSA